MNPAADAVTQMLQSALVAAADVDGNRVAGGLQQQVDDAVEVYFKQCSIAVSTRDLAMMAATLANRGVHPLTGVRVVSETAAERAGADSELRDVRPRRRMAAFGRLAGQIRSKRRHRRRRSGLKVR